MSKATILKPVSVIVPIKNRGYFLPYLIRSLLNLDYPNYEIIIVNDGSSDDTPKIARDYATKSKICIKLISLNDSIGSAGARNIGIKSAKNEIIALTDSDCTVSRNWLNTLIPFLDDYNLIGGKVKFNDIKDQKMYPLSDIKTNLIIDSESFVNFLNTSNMIFRKKDWKTIGGFSKYRLEDVDFSWRALKKDLKLIYVPKGTVYHFHHRNVIQNIERYLNYGKSYQKLVSIHEIKITYKRTSLVDIDIIKPYIKLLFYGIFSFFIISILNIFPNQFLINYIIGGILVSLFFYFIIKILQKTDIIYQLYLTSMKFSIVVFMIIFALKRI